MRTNRFRPTRASIGFAGAFAVLILAMPALAADPTFPPGSRLGLVPPTGMIPSDKFDGFADPDKDAAILITVLPAEAYPQIEKTLDVDALKKKGVTLEKREAVQLSFGKGFLLIGNQTAEKTKYRKWLLVASASDLTALVTVQVPSQDSAYPDSVVRAALATLSVRPTVPEAEELGLLPFVVGDLAGFHVDDVLRGRAVMLSDMPSGKEVYPEARTGAARCTFTDRSHARRATGIGGPCQLRQTVVQRDRRDQGSQGDGLGTAAHRRPIRLSDTWRRPKTREREPT